MTPSLARLAASRDHAAAALRRSVTATLVRRASPGERAWIERIEAKRVELLGDRELTGPSFDSGREGPKGRFSMGRRPTTVGIASEFMSLPAIWCLLLMRLVRELRPQSCLELGTAFGISTAYQAAALELNGRGALTTMEGSPEWAGLAERTLASLGLVDVDTRIGPIGETLPRELDRSGPFDFVYIDAEHQADATLDHFRVMLPGLSDGAVVVLDDVDWPEMKRAQRAIGLDPRVSTSVAVGRLGISVLGRPPASTP
jgi:predicted O-methyltransferase YrrM